MRGKNPQKMITPTDDGHVIGCLHKLETLKGDEIHIPLDYH